MKRLSIDYGGSLGAISLCGLVRGSQWRSLRSQNKDFCANSLPEHKNASVMTDTETLYDMCRRNLDILGEIQQTAFNYVQNTAEGIYSNSDYAEAQCEWDGSKVTSVQSRERTAVAMTRRWRKLLTSTVP